MKLIQKNCHVANVSLAKSSLVIHSFGNISSRIDDKYFTIKPSGANLNILKWAKKNIKKPIVAIGGINNSNYKRFIKSGAKYIAISSYIWDNPKLKPEIAIREFK